MSIIKLSDSSQVTINLDNATISGNLTDRKLLDIERSKDVNVSAKNLKVTDTRQAPRPPYSPPRDGKVFVNLQVTSSRMLGRQFSIHDTIQDLKTYIREREPSYDGCEFVLANVQTNQVYLNMNATLESYGFETQIKLRARQV